MPKEYNPKLDIDFVDINPTYHNFHYEGNYPVIRAKMRLDNEPIRQTLIKARRYNTMDGLAMRTGVTERVLQRIIYRESKESHIDTIDKICLGLDTSLREVYGE